MAWHKNFRIPALHSLGRWETQPESTNYLPRQLADLSGAGVSRVHARINSRHTLYGE